MRKILTSDMLRVFIMFHAFLAFLVFFDSGIAVASALDSWPVWSQAQPFISKQVPPGAMIMRGRGTNSYYVLEVDPATGEIPVVASGTVTATNPSVGTTGSAVPASATFMGGKNAGNLVGVAVDSSGDIINDNLTATATFQAEGSIAFGSVTNVYQTVITTGGVVKVLSMRNSCNQPIGISLDGGSTTAYILEQNDSVAIDLKTNGLKLAGAVALQAKYTGSAPTAGTIRINATY